MKNILNRADMGTRRQFASGVAKTFLGVGLLPGLAGRSWAAGEGASTLRRSRPAKRVIYLYMSGGMSHLDTFDPKEGVDEAGPVRPIKSSADGVRISEYLPRTAGQMHHGVVVRSLTSTQGAHAQGNYMMHTSYAMRPTIKHPTVGPWLELFEGRRNDTLPGSVIVSGGGNNPGAGFLPTKLQPLLITSPEAGLQHSRLRRGTTDEDLEYRLELSARLDGAFRERYAQRGVNAYSDAYDDAIRLMRSEDLRVFDLSEERDAVRDDYGRDSFGQGVLLARRLVERGVGCVEVNLGGWDTHNTNFVRVPELAARLDNALGALLPDLEARGMLDETLVVLATEFGRTPRINQNEGRDHYPKAFTGVMFGGGVRGGSVYGATDATGSEVIDRKVEIQDFNASIGYALGLPLDQVVYSATKRPFTVADKGQPVVELFG